MLARWGPAGRVLTVAAAVELLTLTVLLGNLALAHDPGLASAVGPVHGLAYVTTIGAGLLLDGAPRAARWLTLVPGVGGLLAGRALRRVRTTSHDPAPATTGTAGDPWS